MVSDFSCEGPSTSPSCTLDETWVDAALEEAATHSGGEKRRRAILAAEARDPEHRRGDPDADTSDVSAGRREGRHGSVKDPAANAS
ncbi:hypothetical protein [Nonomuraea dietziae]|uniref:hypothetical protein n=1 Tax=Nonomuraea dietziae TaxID=65515 RepID=UPI0031E2AA1F